MRPQRGSWLMSTIGANACLMPAWAVSSAPTEASVSAALGSKLAASPSGIGKTVR